MPRSVLVVGGGIAGSTLATLLGRARHRVTLVERDAGQRSSGSPVDVRGSALPVVDQLAVTEALRTSDTGVNYVEFVDERGRRRARAMMRRSSAADIEISRSALNAILTTAAADVAEIVHGDGPAQLEADTAGVDVAFESGRQSRFDLVVGTDGQHSTIRQLAFGPESQYARPLGLAIATAPVDPALVSAPDVVQICNVPGACMAVHPAGDQPGVAFIFRTDAERPTERDGQQRELEGRYAGRGWRSAELLAAARDAEDLYFDTVNRVSAPSWSRGRVVLLGDSASSITILGEGCSMAIAGAGSLANALTGTDDVDAAVAAYEQDHQPRVAAAQRGVGYGASVLVPKTARGIGLRNLLVRVARRV